MITRSIAAELEREDADYSSLVTIERDESGSVCSIESNAMNINRLKNNIAARLERELDRMSGIDIMIPVGTLTGLQLLHGRGFDVGMTVSPVGYAQTAIVSEFTEAGLNQTRPPDSNTYRGHGGRGDTRLHVKGTGVRVDSRG